MKFRKSLCLAFTELTLKPKLLNQQASFESQMRKEIRDDLDIISFCFIIQVERIVLKQFPEGCESSNVVTACPRTSTRTAIQQECFAINTDRQVSVLYRTSAT